MLELNINKQDFLTNYWQKKPLLIRNGFAQFEDPISAEELAGLACEEEVSSRVIITKENEWEIIQGPFESYEQYGEVNWQLLVQAVNHWHSDIAPLVEAFRFLPDWRFDDVMASFATPNGGIGAHIDNYDVFIIQGEGKRHWKVGNNGHHNKRNNDPQSALVEDFEPIIDVTLHPGDILYIPPGYPHCGNTISNSMSYSIGFRAPSQQELLTEMADYLLDNNLGHQRFTSTSENNHKGSVSSLQQTQLIALLTDIANQPEQYKPMLGQLLSRNRFELDVCGDQSIEAEDVIDAIHSGLTINRIGGLKVIHIEDDCVTRLFIDGEPYEFTSLSQQQLLFISNEFVLPNNWLIEQTQHHDVIDFLVTMLKMGYYFISE
ncbi:MAG: JmjC domain-containing protein [Parashewanella sp.]